MDQVSNQKITHIKSKIYLGKFGDGKYFGYDNKKIISVVEITLNNKTKAYGESLVGIYSPDLYKKNLKYISKFFINSSLYDALKISKKLQRNKFFFHSGLIKSILASVELAIFNGISILKKQHLAKTLNNFFFNGSLKENNKLKIYSSAGSIMSNLKDIKKDVNFSKKKGIKKIKIRLNLNSDYKNKINLLKKEKIKFAVDLIANTYIKNNILKRNGFLKFIKNFNPMWIEEVINIDDLNYFKKIKKINKLKFSYGENLNSKFDFYNLCNFYKFNFINLDISHITITEMIDIIKYLKKKKIKNKILLHCWGGAINLHSSFELATLFKDYIYMTELPIADFTLNNDYLKKLSISNSILNINSVDRLNINQIYKKEKNIINKNILKKYEFKF